jgi:hypothetical protein
MDILLASTWRLDGLSRFARGGGADVAESERVTGLQYLWKQGRVEVTLDRQADGWRVMSTTIGRLFGPRTILYEASHKHPTHAAWDVMARVIRASKNEDEGVNAGREAARWIRERRSHDA